MRALDFGRCSGVDHLRMHAREERDQLLAFCGGKTLEQLAFARQRDFDDAVVQRQALAGERDRLPGIVTAS